MFSRFARETVRKASQQGHRTLSATGSRPTSVAAPVLALSAVGAALLMNEQKKKQAVCDNTVDMAILKELADIKDLLK